MAEETPEQTPEPSSEQPGNNPKRENPFRRKNFRGKYPRPQRKPESEFPSLDKTDELPASIFPEVVAEKQSQPPSQPQQKQQQRPPQPKPQKHSQPQQQPQPQSQSRNTLVSVIIPLLNEEDSLRELHEQLKNTLSRIGGNYELIFVDDGSTDNSFKVLRELRQRNNRVSSALP